MTASKDRFMHYLDWVTEKYCLEYELKPGLYADTLNFTAVLREASNKIKVEHFILDMCYQNNMQTRYVDTRSPNRIALLITL